MSWLLPGQWLRIGFRIEILNQILENLKSSPRAENRLFQQLVVNYILEDLAERIIFMLRGKRIVRD